MLLLVLAGLYAALLPLGCGVWMVQGIRVTLRPFLHDVPTAPLTIWLSGLALLTALLETWSLFGPVHTGAHLLAVALGGSGLWHPVGRQLLRRVIGEARRAHSTTQLAGTLLLFVALIISCLPPLNVDTGLYHAPAIRWIEEIGVVPGLANADVHLGYNPAWFIPEALFSWGRYVGSPLQVLNTVLLCLFGLYGLGGLHHLLQGRFRPTDLLRMLLATAAVLWLLPELASLSPDPAAAIMAFFVLLQGILLPVPGPKARLQPAHVAVFLLCLFAIKVKLSVAPLLLLPLWWVLHLRPFPGGAFWLKLSGWSVLLMLPWVARSLVLSGYPVFLVSALDFFSFDWKFPADEMQRHMVYIREFARNEEFYHEISIHGKPMSFWLPLWWHRQSLHDKLLTLALPVLLGTMLPLARRQWQQRRLPQAQPLAVALVVALGGVVFWFVMAPSFRFGYGFLLFTLCLLLLPLLCELASRRKQVVATSLTVGFVSVLVVLVLSIEYRYFAVPKTLRPQEYASLSQSIHRTGNIAFLQTAYQYKPASNQFVLAMPAGSKSRYIELMVRHDGIRFTKGLLRLPTYIWKPAPYPSQPLKPHKVGSIPALRPGSEDIPWYAPFPYIARPRFCDARGTRLADGFRAKHVSNVRDWQYEAHW